MFACLKTLFIFSNRDVDVFIIDKAAEFLGVN